jgi:hypothetical protein
MRFPQVQIGQRFSYQGKQYTKTGPLTASEEGTGQSRLIMKAAEVTLLDQSDTGRPQALHRSYSRDEVESLLQAYRSRLGEALAWATEAEGVLDREAIMALIERQPLFPPDNP